MNRHIHNQPLTVDRRNGTARTDRYPDSIHATAPDQALTPDELATIRQAKPTRNYAAAFVARGGRLCR